MDELRTDEALMLAYRDGDAAAFEALYARHRAKLFRYLLRQCGRREQADEMFQEIWMSVIRARSNYEVTAKFTTWLYRIAHNRLVDSYRAAGRQAEFEKDVVDEQGETSHGGNKKIRAVYNRALLRDARAAHACAVGAEIVPDDQEIRAIKSHARALRLFAQR